MHYQATFLTSTTHHAQMPVANKPLYALMGRSNVGKSSLINALFNRKNLARVSSNPGKTSTINYFLINKNWCVTDLPGYGWARQSKTTKLKWEHMIQGFITHNPYIHYVFLLIDARHPPQKNDLYALQWLLEKKVPVALIFTKIDKAKKVYQKHLHDYQHYLQDKKDIIPCFPTSAKTGYGCENILAFIEENISKYHKTQT